MLQVGAVESVLPAVKRSENPSLIAFWYGLLGHRISRQGNEFPRTWARATVSHRGFSISHRSSSFLGASVREREI